MADDLTARIVDLVAKALAEREAGAAAPAARARPPRARRGHRGRIVTREDVQRAAAAGAALQVPAGAILTDLAREEAATQGVTILARPAPPARRALAAADRRRAAARRGRGGPRRRRDGARRLQPRARTTSPARRPR